MPYKNLEDPRAGLCVCCACISQNGGGTKSDVHRLGEVVRKIGHTLAFLDPFDDPVPLGTSGAPLLLWLACTVLIVCACASASTVPCRTANPLLREPSLMTTDARGLRAGRSWCIWEL